MTVPACLNAALFTSGINIVLAVNTQEYNLFAAAGSPAGSVTITLTINSGVYVWSDRVDTPGLTVGGFAAGSSITINNNGFIIGKGGLGVAPGVTTISGVVGNPGGPAMSISNPVTISTPGYIAGGGGSGGSGGGGVSASPGSSGGGAGGGAGGGSSGGVGGGVGSAGANAVTEGGGGGGRILPGIGGAAVANSGNVEPGNGGGAGGGGGSMNNTGGGGAGGSGSAAGGSGVTATGSRGGGGGGWGAAGGVGTGANAGKAGGIGGKAVVTNGHTVTWTAGSQPATVYGAVS